MDQSYNQLFDEKDLLEDNKFQTIYKGCYKNQPQNRVIIQKFKMNDTFNNGFKDFLDSTLQNKLHIEIIDDEIVLVSKHIEGDNISLHLNFSDVTEDERIDYLYEYLHQATAYIGYENYLFNILIGSSQIVFKEHKLYLKEQINLDRKINEDMPFSMVAKNIGQVMQRLLITNYSELKTSITYDELHMFTESLIRREKDYQYFDDLFHDFKAIYFKKMHTKNQTLIGNAHPNNIFIEFEDVDDHTPSAESSTIEPTKEVTDEERAFLMGISFSKDKVDTSPQAEIIVPAIEEPMIEEPDPIEEHKPIDWSKGPIEESIDLSKLSEMSSLDDLFVKDNQPKKIGTTNIKTPSVVENEILEENKMDEPVYGIPNHFKEPQLDQERQQDEEEVKKKINFLIPTGIFAIILLSILGFMWIPSLFDKPVESQPPTALFELVITGDVLRCANKSEAYGEATITGSYWELSKDDVVIQSLPGNNNANFEVMGLSPGVYTVKLTVKDSNDEQSDPFIQEKEYQSPESKALENQIKTQKELTSSQSFKSTEVTEDQMDQYEISTTVNVIEDTSIFNKGTKSYKIDLGKSEGAASLSFDPITIEKGSTVSFMIMTNQANPITIQLLGYNRGENVYNKETVSDKGTVLDWTTISMQMSTTSDIDKLVLRFEAQDTIVWFDELSIRTFK